MRAVMSFENGKNLLRFTQVVFHRKEKLLGGPGEDASGRKEVEEENKVVLSINSNHLTYLLLTHFRVDSKQR